MCLVIPSHDSYKYLAVSKNRATPKSSILIGFSIINHPFWGTSIFENIHLALFMFPNPNVNWLRKNYSYNQGLGLQTKCSMINTLPETNIAPENRPLEKEIPIGNHHF